MALQIPGRLPLSYAIVKENFNDALLSLLERTLEIERKGIIRAGKTNDAREGIAAFLERRKPIFKGQ